MHLKTQTPPWLSGQSGPADGSTTSHASWAIIIIILMTIHVAVY